MMGCTPNGSGRAETGTLDTEAVDETADEVLTVVNSLFQAMQAQRFHAHPNDVASGRPIHQREPHR